MRLIDADALLERAVPHGWSTPLWVSDIVIEDAPTIDAVEVVRCRDCKYGCELIDANGYHYRLCNYKNAHGMMVEDSGYCKWGERKEDEQN